MRHKICSLFAIVFWGTAAPAQSWIVQQSGTTASLRGVSAVNQTVVWASGTGSTWLRTEDGGSTWKSGKVPGAELDFRAVHALDARTAWLLSSGPGANSRIYKTTDAGANWELLYTNPDAEGFFDALAFWDARRAMVLGDPVGGQFVVLTTEDGGRSWRRSKLPPALPKEAAFAASNSSLVLREKSDAWFGTGGPSGSRVYRSSDGGRHWVAADTPMRHEGAAAGIFSVAFSDLQHGVVVGGEYSKPAEAAGNFAITEDGGRTWTAPNGTPPKGYRSAVVFIRERKMWIATGTSGSDISKDGKTWRSFDSASYDALAAAAGAVWAVGGGGRIARLRIP